MFTVTEVSAKRARSSEKTGMQKCDAAFKKFDDAIKRHNSLRKRTAEHIKEIAKNNHEACKKAKTEQQKQAKERTERKEAKEKRLADIEAKISVMFYGFENVKKASDESMNKVNENTKTIDSIAERMDVILNEAVIMHEECKAKDAEILMLHSRINQQDKEIEILKRMIADQKKMLEVYMQFNSKQ